MAVEFIHLHNHSEYSLLDGMLKVSDDKGNPSEFLKGLAQKGVPAFALTDHGNMYGAVDFYFAAKAAGLKPIVGCEMYVAKGSMREKNEQRENGHLTLLAKDYEGYQNLMRMLSEAYLDGYYYDARIDLDLLAKYSKGLIALSGCLKGHVTWACAGGNIDRAVELAGKYRDIMGPGNYYLEMMDHAIPEETEALKGILEVSKRTGIPLVATNDCHYQRKEDWEVHDVHLCISTGRTLDDPNRLKMTTHELYYKSPEEMAALFSHTPEALKNTLAIAEQCNIEIPYGKSILPVFQIPPEEGNATEAQYLEKLCLAGLAKKLGGEIPPPYMERLKFELGVICNMGFPGYFLIVSDFINASRAMGVPVGPGRGSGAGSIVSYAMDITRVDPLVNGLLFERFLNPERISMPDLDIDFSDEGRAKAIEYVREKYGKENVAQIVTFGTMKAKMAVKDVARVMGMEPSQANAITKLIPGGPEATLFGAMNDVAELKEMARDPQVKKVLDFALKIEGFKRNTGVHAAGIVITREPVYRYSPLARGSRDVITTQYEGEPLVKLGLLKMDFLGLRTLTIIDNAVKLIKRLRGIDIDIQKIPLDDQKTYDMLCAAKTTCIFQLESGGMRDLVRGLKPSQFSDISALVALYRPGPMQSGMLDIFVDRKHGRKKITYEHKLLEPILKETYGTMIYQEQVMEISKSLAGFTPGQADGLRKAMGKKNLEAMQKMRAKFMDGCAKKQIPEKLANKIFDQMAEFASYGFNKSHSVAYALVSYQTAYLKANYPAEFLTAALTSEIGHNAIGSEDKENKIVTYIQEANDMGFPVLPPSVAKSFPDFGVEKDGDRECIRFGLRCVKNVGDEAAASIVRAREAGGPFTDLNDICSRVDLRQANRKTFESLIKAGAMDCLFPGRKPEESRAELLAGLEEAMSRAGAIKEAQEQASESLFGADFNTASLSSRPSLQKGPVDPLSEHDMLHAEKEVLGLYMSGHPLVKYEEQLKMVAPASLADILGGKVPGGNRLRIAGLIASVSKKTSKKTKEPWAQFVLEDLSASIPVNCFPKSFQKNARSITSNSIVVVSGRLNVDSDGESTRVEISADEVVELYEAIDRFGKFLFLKFPATLEEDKLKSLRTLLDSRKGHAGVYLKLHLPTNHSTIIQTGFRVELSRALLDDVEKILGPKSWLVETSHN